MIKQISQNKKLVVSGSTQFVVDLDKNDVFRSNYTEQEIAEFEDDLIGFDLVSAVDAAKQKSEHQIASTTELGVILSLVELMNTTNS